MAPIGWYFFVTGVVVLAFYLVVNGVYLAIHVAALFKLRTDLREREWGPMYQQFSSPFLPGVAVVVPAYNEAPVIVDSVQSLLNLNYPDTDIVVVNDGSTDDTLDRLREAFDLERIEASVPFEVPSEQIHAVYRSADASNLVVVDKDNGGKSDALNAGIWLTDKPLFCAVDADSIIDRDGLRQVVRPFLEHPEETVAVGGTVRVANGCTVENGQITDVSLPDSALAEVQVMEYLRAFYSGRLGLDRLGSLLLISGAFGVFRTDVVRDIGGYRTESVTEDFELVVRLHRHLLDAGREYNVEFVPEPVVWTEVPESRRVLGRQRNRWYRGLLDTLIVHRGMFGRPRYGSVGLLGYPVLVIIEGIAPLVEGLGYLAVLLAFLFGAADIVFVLAYLALTIGVGVFLSWFGVFSEVWSFRRYDSPREVLRLLGAGVVENFGYRQWKVLVSWKGLVDYLFGDRSWGAMGRAGFDGADGDDDS